MTNTPSDRKLRYPIVYKTPPIPDNEQARLESVRDLNLQDAESIPELVAIRDTAQRLLGVQAAVITNIEENVMRILTARMLPGRDSTEGRALELQDFEVPRDCTICQHTIMEPGHLIAPDLKKFIVLDSPGAFDKEFVNLANEMGGYPTPWPMEDGTIGMHGTRFYAGATIQSSTGNHFGTLCVMDENERPDFGEEEIEILESLARLAAEYMEQRALLCKPPNFRLLQQRPARTELTESLETRDVDVVVIGGGPAGVTLACRLAFQRLHVVLVEPKEYFGAPTGVVSKIYREAALQKGSDTTWEDVTKLLSTIAPHEAKRVRKLLDEYGAQIIQGKAHIAGLSSDESQQLPRELVEVSRDGAIVARLNARATVLATGSSARPVPGIPYDSKNIFDSDTIALLDRKPQSLLVIGGGLIGLEYAMIFARMGVAVTIAIRGNRERMLPQVERALTDALLSDLDTMGVEVLWNTSCGKAKVTGNSVTAWLNNGDNEIQRNFEVLLPAAGRFPSTDGLGIEGLYEKENPFEGAMPDVDSRQRLVGAAGAAYAVGDVSGGPGLACHAILQAQRASDDLLPLLVKGRRFKVPEPPEHKNFVAQPPSVVWTIPEIAFVGMHEKQAAEELGTENIVCGTAHFSDTVRGSLIGISTKWFIKLICMKSDGRVIDVHLYGEGAAELVHYGAALVGNHTTAFDLQYRSFPAVTLHEIYRIASLAVIEKLAEAARSESN